MAIILVLLSLVFIMVILRLVVARLRLLETFQNSIPTTGIDPVLSQAYTQFSTFFNQFQTNWKKAIVSSIASDTPQQPLTSPSHISSGQTSTQPSDTEINTYIQTLSSKEQIQFPPISPTLPNDLTLQNIATIIPQIPSDSTPYKNALQWMNNQLSKAHSNLDIALTGGSITEGFYQESCSDIAQCIQNNPALIAQIGQATATAVAQQTEQTAQDQQAKLLQSLQNFNKDTTLTEQSTLNQQLVQKSQDIQNQAQSGALINKINVPGGNTIAKYDLPPGADTLKQLQKTNPERYNELKTNFSTWTTLKEMLEQINSNL